MERSIFTKIIDRDVPATIEYEDERVIAIRDIAPAATVHLLIIPKKPLQSANAITPEDHEMVGHIYEVARQLAEKFKIAESGYRVVTNVNEDGGQTVPHLHFHLLGGESLGRMTSAGSHIPSTPAKPTSTKRPTFWRDLAIFVVVAIGLAYSYNEMNPKRIQWVRPVYAADTLEYTPPSVIEATTGGQPPEKFLTSAEIEAMRKDSISEAKRMRDSLRREKDLALTTNVDTTKPAAPPCFEAQSGVIKEIRYEQFISFLSKPCVVLIDARIPESYGKGHIGNAINIDGTEAESPAVIQRLIGLPRDKIVLIYCDGGECELSHRVADVLKNFGFGPIYIYKGGWAEWSTKKK